MGDVQTEFGARVRFLRQRAGLSQESLAANAGLHTTYVSGVERGKYNVSLQNMVKLANGLQVTVLELFGGEKAPPQPSEAEKVQLAVLNLLKHQRVPKLRMILNVVRELTKVRS